MNIIEKLISGYPSGDVAPLDVHGVKVGIHAAPEPMVIQREMHGVHPLVVMVAYAFHFTLTDIVDAMHFSSQPALTRYMKRVLNTTPSEFRQNSKS